MKNTHKKNSQKADRKGKGGGLKLIAYGQPDRKLKYPLFFYASPYQL